VFSLLEVVARFLRLLSVEIYLFLGLGFGS
jgi:hypothetical protein